MDYWDILSIDPTDDISKIKKAYAEKSKIVHPEDHPEEFMQLRNAYKYVVSLQKRRILIDKKD